jgi:predicted glycoside hydrolase/deacetylase ChbG (UPF0249 family)
LNKRLLVVIIVAALLSYGLDCAAETYAERLGWGPTDRVVIFHVDDAGMSHSSNQGAIEAVEGLIATSTSLMMPCGWIPEMAQYLVAHPAVDSGVHLTLTAEWDKYRWSPLAGYGAVPGLVDPEGSLWGGVEQVAMNATADEVDAEMRAQVARAEMLGIPITHLDSHMGTVFAREDLFQRYVALGIEKNIPIMIAAGHLTYVRAEQPPSVVALLETGAADAVWNAGLPVLDDLHTASYGWSRESKVANFSQLMRDLQPGITQIIIHATRPTEEFALISSSGDKRLGDLEAMLSPELLQVIHEEGIILTTWRELKERRDDVGGGKMPTAKATGLAALGAAMLVLGVYYVPGWLKAVRF